MTWAEIYGLLISLATIVICTTLHASMLQKIGDSCPESPNIFGIKRLMLLVIGLHMVEILIFAGAYWLSWEILGIGEIRGAFAGTAVDYVYFSLVCYTTIGFGDITPEGALRILAGLEGITGLVLITWSATFTFTFVIARREWHDFSKM